MTPKKAGFQNNDHKDEKRKGKQSRMKKNHLNKEKIPTVKPCFG